MGASSKNTRQYTERALLRRMVLEHLLPMYLIAKLLDSLVVDEETVDSVKTGPMTEVSYMRYSGGIVGRKMFRK
jgi:hypothetical protein